MRTFFIDCGKGKALVAKERLIPEEVFRRHQVLDMAQRTDSTVITSRLSPRTDHQVLCISNSQYSAQLLVQYPTIMRSLSKRTATPTDEYCVPNLRIVH